MSQLIAPELIEGLSAYFPRSNASATAWGNVISNYLGLRNLRFFIPFTSVDENGDPYDLSGQGRVLTNNNTISFLSNGLLTYAKMGRAASHYFNRLDETGLDITGELTIGIWVYLNAIGSQEGFIGKYNTSGGVNQRVYLLYKTNGDVIRFVVSSNGTATTIVSSTVTATATNWLFLVGRYTPFTELAIWVNGTKTTNIAAIPGNLSNQPSSLLVGQDGAGPANYIDGRVALAFLCSAALEDCFINALFWHSCPLFGVKP